MPRNGASIAPISVMEVCTNTDFLSPGDMVPGKPKKATWGSLLALVAVAFSWVYPAYGQVPMPNWQGQVRAYVEAKDWYSAMRLVEQEIARAPQDMDVRAWRARVLAWSGKLPEAEKEYLAILQVSRTDPDNWMGLADVYLRQGNIREALQAINVAEELDPKRPDIHAARARALRVAGQRNEARSEFQAALRLG